MKKSIWTIAILAALASSSQATEPRKADKLGNQVQKDILSPALEKLFNEERLNEAIVKPTYSVAEQLIFSEQVKQLKSQKVKK
jgi:hypothetical protein